MLFNKMMKEFNRQKKHNKQFSRKVHSKAKSLEAEEDKMYKKNLEEQKKMDNYFKNF